MTIKDKHTYKKLIDINYICQPRYCVWFSRDYWYSIDAACLFNGVNPDNSSAIKLFSDKSKTRIINKKIRFLEYSDSSKFFRTDYGDILRINIFLLRIVEEANAISTWAIPHEPLLLVNKYLREIGDIPRSLFKSAAKSFLELYRRRDDSDKLRKYWNNYWHNNIAEPFLKLITNEDIKTPNQTKPNQNTIDSTDHNNNSVNEKIISEESTKAREIRIRNRGHEIYKIFKEQNPTKKITKEYVAKQIMKEEESIYKLISIKNPLRKQPALGTYLKELRKTH